MARLTREQSRLRTRELLLESARREFARTGYAGASLETIAENAGFSRGAVYANFASKEAVFLEILRRFLANEVDQSLRLVADGVPLEVVFDAASRRINEACADPTSPLLGMELQLNAARDPAVARTYEDTHAAYHARLAELFEAIFSRAGKRPPADGLALASLMNALGQAVVLIAVRDAAVGKSFDAGGIYSLVLRGLIAAAEPREASTARD